MVSTGRIQTLLMCAKAQERRAMLPDEFSIGDIQLGMRLDFHRPVGIKFEMFRPYYNTKCVHNVLGHAPAPPRKRYRIVLLSNYLLGHFEELLSLDPKDLVAAVALENEAVLSAFFIVFAAIKA